MFLNDYRAMLAQSAVMRLLSSVRLSVRPYVTIRYRVQIGLNSSNIISRPNRLDALIYVCVSKLLLLPVLVYVHFQFAPDADF